MLLSESKFNLQSINISEFNQEFDQESDLNAKLKLKVNQDSIEEAISIHCSVSNHSKQLYKLTIYQYLNNYWIEQKNLSRY